MVGKREQLESLQFPPLSSPHLLQPCYCEGNARGRGKQGGALGWLRQNLIHTISFTPHTGGGGLNNGFGRWPCRIPFLCSYRLPSHRLAAQGSPLTPPLAAPAPPRHAILASPLLATHSLHDTGLLALQNYKSGNRGLFLAIGFLGMIAAGKTVRCRRV